MRATRAGERWKGLLRDYLQPPLDPAVDEARAAYVGDGGASMPDLSYG